VELDEQSAWYNPLQTQSKVTLKPMTDK